MLIYVFKINMKELCRLCLKKASSALNMYDDNSREMNIAQILAKHFWFELCSSDPISTFVCLECWNIVDGFHKFYMFVEEAQKVLSNNTCSTVCLNEVSENIDAPSDIVQPVQQLEMTIDIKEEYMDNSMWQEHMRENADKSELNPLEDNEATSKENERNALTDTEVKKEESDASAVSTAKPKKPIEGATTRKRAAASASSTKIISSKRRKRCKKVATNKNERCPKTNKKLRKKRQTMMTERDEELIKKYISMGCELCPFVGENFVELTAHFRIQHESQKAYVVCCGRKLNKRFLIVQHAYKHEDPEYYKCKECNKVFADSYVLRNHMLANHVPDEELLFSCDQCPKKFSRRYLLELHKPSHIPPDERKFWCKICPEPKVFASDHLLQIHTNMRHTRAPNVCHVCAKEIRDNQAFEKHVRLHFEDSGPRVKCPHPDCDRWLKDEDNLKQHMRRHNDEGKTFVCNECGKGCKNRRSLTSHINYAHTNEVFTCEECNKTFKKAITLREHMAQHTGETLYKCPFCTRTFNSNANMHSHKKKIHPLEWDIWRKTKKSSSQQLVTSSSTVKAPANNVVNVSAYSGNSLNDALLMEHNFL